MRGRQRGWAALLLGAAAAVAALGPLVYDPAPAGAAGGATWDVAAANNAFSPAHLTIKPGDRVLWTNEDKSNIKHSVTSDSGSTWFDEDLGRPGATFERRFDVAGTYTYHCKYHSNMVGTIDVGSPAPTTTTAPPPPPPPTTTTSTTLAPATTTTTVPPTTATTGPTTTTGETRPAAGAVPPPPVGASAAAPPPASSSTSTSATRASTTTTVPPTTATSGPPPTVVESPPVPPAPAPATSSTQAASPGSTGGKNSTAAGPPAGTGGKLDVAAAALVAALVAVGLFGAWTLIRIRPGRV